MMNLLTQLRINLMTNAPRIMPDVIDKANSVFDDVYGKIKRIATPVGVMAGAAAFLIMIFSQDPQSSKIAKNWLYRIAFGLLGIYLIPELISTVVAIVA